VVLNGKAIAQGIKVTLGITFVPLLTLEYDITMDVVSKYWPEVL